MNTTLVRRNLSGKNVFPRPLRVSSFLGLIVGSFMLMTMAAPSAHAVNLLTYYDFEDGNFTSDSPGLQTTTISFTDSSYPGGNLNVVDTAAGTNVNAVTPSTDFALDARGNDNVKTGDQFCFVLGAINTTGQTDITLSFAILSDGSGQFTNLSLFYSTNGTIFTSFSMQTNLTSFTTYTTQTYPLPTGAENQSTLYIEFCFSGASNNNTNNNTFIDNIQVTGTPEPTTAVGGALTAVGLCWRQRKRLSAFLRARLAKAITL